MAQQTLNNGESYGVHRNKINANDADNAAAAAAAATTAGAASATATAASTAAAAAQSAASTAQTAATAAQTAATAAAAKAATAIQSAIAFSATTGVATKPDGSTFQPATGVAPSGGYGTLTCTSNPGNLPTAIDGITAMALNDSLLWSSPLNAWTLQKATLAVEDLSNASSVQRMVGTYATAAALQTAKPAASNIGSRALVGSAAPYTAYTSDGVSWNTVSTGGTLPLTVSGTYRVGNTLTAALASGWAVTGYQWSRNGVPISGATNSTYVLTSPDNGATVTCAGIGLAYVAVGSSVAAQLIGGVAAGSAGSGIFSGFSLIAGDDFDSLPSRHSGSNPTGKYASSTPHSGIRRLGAGGPAEIYLDPAWRGWHSDSPVPYGVDPLSAANSVLTITASPNSSSSTYYGSMPTTYTGSASTGYGDAQSKPRLISGAIDTWPSFLVSAAGDFMFFAKIRVPAGVARGWWPSMWTTTVANWPDYGEIDVFEQVKDPSTGAVTYGSTLHVSATDGAGDTGGAGAQVIAKGSRSVPTATWVTYGVKKQGTTLTFYDDITTPGTLAVAGTYTNSLVSRVRGSHRFRMELNASGGGNWDSQTFSISDWPKSIDIDWWQAWVPTSVYAPYVSPTVLTPIQTTPGGSWAGTFPSAASLYGSTPTVEEYDAWFDNDDAPGQETKTGGTTGVLPGGMTIDMTGRTTSGTVPTTRGGRTGILLAGSFATGGQARQAMMLFDVAPAAQATLFASFSVGYAQPVNQTISYTDFHSGNLGGPTGHSYTVTNDSGGWLSVAYGANNNSVTLSGTSPSSTQTVTITITCTNVNGQATTVTRTLSVANLSIFSDNFDRANSPLEANGNWTKVAGYVGALSISSNSVQYAGTDTNGALYTSPDLGSQRQYVQGTMFSGVGGFFVVQATDALNYIGIRRNGTSNVIEVYKKVAGTLTAQCAFAETVTDTDVMRLEFISNVLTVKKNGTTLTPTSGSLTVSGGPPASTRTGLVGRINSSIPMFDNYTAGVL